MPSRRALLACLPAAALLAGPLQAAPRPRLLVLPTEMADDHDNPATREAQARRLPELTDQLRRELAQSGLFDVVDLSVEAARTMTVLAAQRASLRDCDVCAEDIGRAQGIDLVMTPWIYKISELILILNLQIYSVAAGRLVYLKGVQMRGNRDDSWQRAAHYLVRDMAEHPGAWG